MTSCALFWLVLFGVAAPVFFGMALVVSLRGFSDVYDLLGSSHRRDKDCQVLGLRMIIPDRHIAASQSSSA
ncbi:MAG: hypothetical protein NTU47_04705 [Ignavibacteriales bacterium]|nr:hypothetical protein [Ignavibacteriales bacterium]